MVNDPLTPWLRTLAPASRFILHGDRRTRDSVSMVWGVPFAEHACGAVAVGDRATLWLGPDEYLLWNAARDSDPGVTALEQALTDLPHALVDISHRQMGFEISGPQAETVLGGACPLDLDISKFPVAMCTRTVLAKAEIVLWRTRADAFHLEVWRSFVPYVTALLGEIGRDC
jgi:sarcosine oxidase subunit gamma